MRMVNFFLSTITAQCLELMFGGIWFLESSNCRLGNISSQRRQSGDLGVQGAVYYVVGSHNEEQEVDAYLYGLS